MPGVKNIDTKPYQLRSLFASIARALERTWYDFGTNRVRRRSVAGKTMFGTYYVLTNRPDDVTTMSFWLTTIRLVASMAIKEC